MTVLDRRLHAYRDDLADQRLAGQVSAKRFVEGRSARISAAVADLRRSPRHDSGIDTQLLRGALVSVFDETAGFCWVQAALDGYVGYVAAAVLGPVDPQPTHRVAVPRSFVYPGPDLRFPPTSALSMGSEIAIVGHAETRGTRYALLSSGEAVIEAHLCALDAYAADYVAVAEAFLNTPYLWGGVSGFGIDCSGLLQLSMQMAGRAAPRDSDMQAAGFGTAIDPGVGYGMLQRGDLVFWKGHVAIMTDAEQMIHANGHTMLVSRESSSGSDRPYWLSLRRADGLPATLAKLPFLLNSPAATPFLIWTSRLSINARATGPGAR